MVAPHLARTAASAEGSTTSTGGPVSTGGGPSIAGGRLAPQRPAALPPVPRPATVKREEPKVGRNDPCPCGSGKKYKKCHGVNEASA